MILSSLLHHRNLIARKCYYQPCQLLVVSRSPTYQSRLTFVHVFVTSGIDCCNTLLSGLPPVPWLGWTEFCVRLPVLLWGGPSFLPSLPTCVMFYIGCLSLSEYNIVSLQWSPIVSFDVSPLTFVTSAAQCSAARGELLVPWLL